MQRERSVLIYFCLKRLKVCVCVFVCVYTDGRDIEGDEEKRRKGKREGEGSHLLFECILTGKGDPKNWNLFIYKLCIYSYMFKLQPPSKYSPLDATRL